MIDALSGLFALLVRRPLVALTAIAVITAGLVFGASGVTLDGDLARLLPESAESVKGLERLQKVYGDEIGRITVVLSASDDVEQSELIAAADGLVPKLSSIDGVDRIEAKQPQARLDDLRLLYLDKPDLETIEQRIGERVKWEKKRANPLFVDLGGGEPPELDFSDIEEKYSSGSGYFVGDSGRLLVFVRPNFSATDLDRTKSLVENVQTETSSYLSDENPKIEAAYTGRYVKRIEQQSLLIEDIGKATSIALLLLALLLLGYFRSFVTVVEVLIPLVVGTAAAMTIATMLFGSLNILTGFLGAILLGLGVDYGIHLVSRLHEELRDKSLERAIKETFETTGKANLFAGMTTAAALGSLTVSSFRAFLEFGVIALIGIACILTAYLLVLPSLAAVARKISDLHRPSLSSLAGSRLDSWLASHDASEREQLFGKARRVARSVLVGSFVVAALGAWQIDLDTSFENLTITNTETWRLDQRVNEILGESQTPAVVLVESAEHERDVVETLEARMDSDPEAIQKILSRRDVLPDDEAEKVEIIESIADKLRDVPERARSDELRDFLAEVDGILEMAPIEMEDLPVSIRRPFSRADGEGSVVLVLPGLDLNDLANSQRFVELVQDLPGPDGDRIDALSDAMLLTEIFEFVQADIMWMVVITFIGLVLIAFLAFGFRRDAFIMLGTLGLSLAVALGAMGLLDVDFNFINVMIIPIWLGLGVDASFHILMHIRQHADRVSSHVTTTGAVAAAFLTSMTGFGAMIVSHHNGLSSLAAVAIIGLSSILVVNLAVATLLSTRAQSQSEQNR